MYLNLINKIISFKMKRGPNKHPVNTINNKIMSPKETPQPPSTPSGTNMEEDKPSSLNLEIQKESVNLDELQEEKSLNKKRNIDISDDVKDPKKGKKIYDLDDTIIRDITLNGNIHVKLLSNANGYFVDVRRYNRDFPTQKGIRMLATKFATAADMLKNDLSELIPKMNENNK